jgi:hypothetical protein
VKVILASVAVVVVVVVVVVVEIISTLVVVAVGRGGDYLDTSNSSSGKRVSREISCSESVLWTTNCPLVLAYSGLGDSGHFPWSLYTFRIQSVFLLFIKYTHDYPHDTESNAKTTGNSRGLAHGLNGKTSARKCHQSGISRL